MLLIVIYHILEVNAVEEPKQTWRADELGMQSRCGEYDDLLSYGGRYVIDSKKSGQKGHLYIAGKLCGTHLVIPFNIMIPLEPAYRSYSPHACAESQSRAPYYMNVETWIANQCNDWGVQSIEQVIYLNGDLRSVESIHRIVW
ncbi:hypothetical protein EYC84_009781 [Monilinia fructicola]|uniref:Uncharacterized protein n=1 Tax=Monilinia fructicola TaxID=38448 RepID=A0A5M9JB31_MONFR|nr:hypothetical protein EYC84_009781 [Monilinia fructicola]